MFQIREDKVRSGARFYISEIGTRNFLLTSGQVMDWVADGLSVSNDAKLIYFASKDEAEKAIALHEKPVAK